MHCMACKVMACEGGGKGTQYLSHSQVEDASFCEPHTQNDAVFDVALPSPPSQMIRIATSDLIHRCHSL